MKNEPEKQTVRLDMRITATLDKQLTAIEKKLKLNRSEVIREAVKILTSVTFQTSQRNIQS